MAQEHALSHVVGSLYDFGETAGLKIVSSFRSNSSSDISCHFNDGNLFTIYPPHLGDESLACLLNCIKSFISLEKNQIPDLFESEKLTRISGTHSSVTHVSFTHAVLTEQRMQASKPNGEAPLIEHENIIRRWSPNTESQGLGSNLSLQLLGRIENLCGCRIDHASDSADLLIKADREQDVERSMLKLQRLNKMMVDETSFPRIHSYYYLEGEMSVDLRLVAFKDLNDKRPVTTLLPKGSLCKSLRDLCVLVLVKGSEILPVNSKPAASSQDCRLLNEHVYSCNQAQGPIAVKTPKEAKTPIDRWVSEVTDTDAQMDVFHPESIVEVQQLVGVGKGYVEPLSPTKKSITKRARTARGNPDAFNKAFTESQHEQDGKEARTQETVAIYSGQQTTRITSTDKESESRRPPPSIEPPYMPPLAFPSRSLFKMTTTTSQQLTPSSSTWNDVVVRGSKSGSLVDTSVPNEGCDKDEALVFTDRLQDTTKAKARDLKHTMNQRKAPTQASMGGDTTLVKSFEETITRLLVLALPRTGLIGFTVDIGRFLINQQHGPSEFKNKSFKPSEFSSVLPKGKTNGFEPIFTDMLTARSSEAESIVNLLLAKGRRLFQQEPTSRNVRYIFSCKAKGGDQIIVEYDGNRGFSIQGTEILMGTLDWHFPKRAWDARLRLTSSRFLTTDHQGQVKVIIDNLKIQVSEDGKSLELWTRATDDNLRIESITLRRETLHPVILYPDLILHMTEYQDMQVRQSSDSESVYSGSIQASNAMIRANKLWWGARITSINASTILKENSTLELGKTATWTPSSIVNKGVVRDLFAAAKEIVTQIDHVGFFNRGEGSLNSKTTEKPSENTRDLSARLSRVDPGYW